MAYCGLMCNECAAYIATAKNDNDLRRKTAEEWSNAYGMEIKPEDINCLGCNSNLRISHCDECEIRACGIENSLNHCGECSSFGCSKIENFLKYAPEARERLEKLRK
jgi:hypothetical protein